MNERGYVNYYLIPTEGFLSHWGTGLRLIDKSKVRRKQSIKQIIVQFNLWFTQSLEYKMKGLLVAKKVEQNYINIVFKITAWSFTGTEILLQIGRENRKFVCFLTSSSIRSIK